MYHYCTTVLYFSCSLFIVRSAVLLVMFLLVRHFFYILSVSRNILKTLLLFIFQENVECFAFAFHDDFCQRRLIATSQLEFNFSIADRKHLSLYIQENSTVQTL